jgi:tripartite-type tricarboxylate transporter receptor subunit TctC
VKSFAPVAIVAQSPLLLVIHPSVPAKTLKELVAYAKANPGKVHFPSPGFGTQPHLVGEMFKSMTGLDIVHVPYRGSAPAITDLLAGQMQIYFDNFANLLQHVESGKLKAIAVTGDGRSPQLPDVATMGQSGYGGIAATYWNGIFAPAGTPAAVIARLNVTVNQALATPEVRAALQKLGSDPKTGTPQEFTTFIAAESERWGKVVRDANIRVE